MMMANLNSDRFWIALSCTAKRNVGEGETEKEREKKKEKGHRFLTLRAFSLSETYIYILASSIIEKKKAL